MSCYCPCGCGRVVIESVVTLTPGASFAHRVDLSAIEGKIGTLVDGASLSEDVKATSYGLASGQALDAETLRLQQMQKDAIELARQVVLFACGERATVPECVAGMPPPIVSLALALAFSSFCQSYGVTKRDQVELLTAAQRSLP